MKFFTSVTTALAIGSAVAASLQARDVKIGAVTTILATMNSTLTQDQAITNELIAQLKAGTASEVALAKQMASIVGKMGSEIVPGGSQIASSLESAAVTLTAPDIAVLTEDLKSASAYAKSATSTFSQQASAAASSFSKQVAETSEAEILAAEAALQPFLTPMIAFAKSVKSDGSAQADAGKAALASAVSECVLLVSSLNKILGISTS